MASSCTHKSTREKEHGIRMTSMESPAPAAYYKKRAGAIAGSSNENMTKTSLNSPKILRRADSARPASQSRGEDSHGLGDEAPTTIRQIKIHESIQVWAMYLQEMLCLLGRGGAYLSSLMMAFVLGGFGAFMVEPILWSCLAIVVLTPITSLAIRPIWVIVSSHLQVQERSLLSPVGTGESLATVVKILLASNLLALLYHGDMSKYLDSHSCTFDCRHRARESLMAVCFFILFLEGLPALMSRAHVVPRYHFWISLISGQHQYDLRMLLKTIVLDKQLHSHQASAVSVIIIVTVGLLLGGDFGIYLSRPCFWLCWFIFTVEVVAEGIYFLPHTRQQLLPHIRNEGRPLQYKGRLSHHILATSVWRFLLQGSLSIALIGIVARGTFYPSDLPEDVCDGICRRSTKRLLTVTCIAALVQGAGIFLVQSRGL